MIMAIENPAPTISIAEFNCSKQLKLFETLKREAFTGELLLKSAEGVDWVFYLYLGRIFSAAGGCHPVRRWYRNVNRYCAQVNLDPTLLKQELAQVGGTLGERPWEYQLLSLWVKRQIIERRQAESVIESILVEMLFDITQATEVTFEVFSKPFSANHIVLVDAEKAILEADKLWKAWQTAKIADRSPNRAPIIRQHEELKQRTSEATYGNLSKLLNGRHTLRDLAIKLQHNVVDVTVSLLPYLQMGLVDLTTVKDWTAPYTVPTPPKPATPVAMPNGPVIACVDDSPAICHAMESILTESGYQAVTVKDAMRALAVILERRPDLIFLDLVMPNANGYEICSQLRKLSFFRQTPIVILTGNDGVIDRVRAKMVGATDFISKPVKTEMVLGTIRKHLKASVIVG